MSIHEKGPVRIHFEEKGSGFPLLMIAGGGLNSTIANLSAPYSPFDAMDALMDEYRCVGADLRNANGGQSDREKLLGRQLALEFWIVMQNDIQQRPVDFQMAVVINKTQFSKLIHEKIHA